MPTVNASMNLYTVQQVAGIFGCVDSRIRQLCIKHDIGIRVGHPEKGPRLLTDADIAQIESLTDTRLTRHSEKTAETA
jgi:hypothetical protein